MVQPNSDLHSKGLKAPPIPEALAKFALETAAPAFLAPSSCAPTNIATANAILIAAFRLLLYCQN